MKKFLNHALIIVAILGAIWLAVYIQIAIAVTYLMIRTIGTAIVLLVIGFLLWSLWKLFKKR